MADWPPLKNSAFTVTFPIYDADGDLVTAAGSLDSEVSKDGGTFTDVSPGEASEIATSSGVYTLALSATEMNADIVAVITKSTSGKTAVNVMYTVTRQLKDVAFPTVSGRSIGVETDGHAHADLKEWLGVAPSALSATRVQTHLVSSGASSISVGAFSAGAITAGAIGVGAIESDAFAAGAINAAAIATDAIAAAKIATGAITAAKFAAGALDAAALNSDAVDEIVDQVWDEARSGHVGAGSFGEGVASVQGNVTGSVGSVTGAVGSVAGSVGSIAAGGIASTSFAAGAINAAAIANNAIDAAALATDTITAAKIADDAITAAKIATDAIAADGLAADAVTEIRSLANGTSDAGGSTTTMVDAARTEADDIWTGAWILFTSGAVSGQCRLITNFVAATDTITFAPAVSASIGAGFTYEILPNAGIDVQSWKGLLTSMQGPTSLSAGNVFAHVDSMASSVVSATALASDAANKIADEVLSVDVGDVEATMPLHSLGTAVLKAVSRIVDDAGTLKLYRTNGTTLHMSQTITVNASADPIDELTVGV